MSMTAQSEQIECGKSVLRNGKAMVYTAIGGIIMYKAVRLRVMPTMGNAADCMGCYFSDAECNKRGVPHISCYKHGHMCTESMRKDKQHVIFIEEI